MWLIGRKSSGRLVLGSTFGPLGELQSLEVCCDVIEGVVRTRLEDLAWLTFMSEVSLFASTSFFSPADALVFCTKAVVQGLCFLPPCTVALQGIASVVAAGAPQEMGVVGGVDGVAGIRGDGFQVGLLRCHQILPRQPQEACVATQCLGVLRLRPRRPLEVVFRPVTWPSPNTILVQCNLLCIIFS
ncbi:hypothetical protein BHM03_00018940 [Ensete ventricosum]|nr:hypothetical protein BHM03_00018940 [Ensete ventricosum]